MDDRRVLFITRKWEPAIGGMETYCVKVVERLKAHHAVDVIALSGRDDGHTPTMFGLLLFPFTVLRRWFGLARRPDIVHLGDLAIWPLALLQSVLAPNAKIAISAHGTDISYALRSTSRGRLYRRYQELGASWLSDASIIANSDATADACRAIGWQNVSIVPLATDMVGEADPAFDRNTILFAGRIIPMKGLCWFIENVLALLPSQTRVAVAGIATDPDEARIIAHDQVDFLGPLDRSQLAKRYSSALCVVLPNIERPTGEFEGFGLVACEAAACGGVVLASDHGGLSSAVVDGQTGFLLPQGDAKAWAQRIEEVAAWDDRERVQFLSTAQKVARRQFNWSRVATETSASYSVAQSASSHGANV